MLKLLPLALSLLCAVGARASTIEVLSAGAVEPGLVKAAAAYTQATGETVRIRYATPAVIREQLLAGTVVDVVIAPPAVLEALAAAGKVAADKPVPLGKVGVGVAIREGMPIPDIATPDTFGAALVAAPALAYNRASTGTYIEALLKRMGLYQDLEARSKRFHDGAAVMEHAVAAMDGTLALGAITEIRLYTDKGLHFIGPLPASLQNYTRYAASVAAAAPSHRAAQAFVGYLGTPAVGTLMTAAGLDPF